MNTQPIEKADLQADGTLKVHSVFYTIQGEGPNTGRPAVFVRLAGCNLQCPGCDTDYTSVSESYKPARLVEEVLDAYQIEVGEEIARWKPILVITGGEPFRQNITPFANHMAENLGWTVQIETNGTLPPHGNLNGGVQIVVSPKTGKIHPEIEMRAIAFKYVVKAGCIDRADGLPIRALEHPCSPVVAKPGPVFLCTGGPIYLQPYDDRTIRGLRDNLSAAVNSCKKFGHTLQIQTHKIAGIE